jgi:tetratricopeptide (TPR) repeat protein
MATMAQGRAGQCQEAWLELAGAYRQAGHVQAAAVAQLEYIACLNALGATQTIPELLERWRADFEQLAPVGQARRWRIAAVTHGLLGDIPTALAEIERSIEYYRVAGEPLNAARSRLERAWLWFRYEQYAAADQELTTLQAFFKRVDLPLQLAFAERTGGFVANRLGRYNQALALAVSARERFATFGRSGDVADCEMEIGNVAFYSGLRPIAMAAYRLAEGHYNAIGSDRLRLISLRNQALLLCADGQPRAGLDVLAIIEPQVAEIGDQFELGEIMQAQGQALADLGQYRQALARLRAAEQHFEALGNRPAAAESVLHQGWQHLALGNFQQADGCFAEAGAALANRPVHRWRAEYGRGRCAEQFGAPGAALEWYRSAGAVVAALRHTLASEHASSGIFRQAQQVYFDALRLAGASGNGELVLTLAEQQRALVLQHQIQRSTGRFSTVPLQPAALHEHAGQPEQEWLRHAIQTSLEVRHADRSDPGDPAQLDLAECAARIDAAYGQAWHVLFYVQAGDELLIVTFNRHGCTLMRLPLARPMRRLLERATQPRYRQYVYMDVAYQQGTTRQRWEVLSQLGAALIPDTVRAELMPETRLLIVADGDLNALPWGALRVGERWLCEQAVVQLVPSLALWQLLQARPLPAGQAALLVGCDTFGERAPALPFVGRELATVAAAWPGPVVTLHNQAASIGAIEALSGAGELARLRLIHIATHAQLRSQYGLRAYIALWDGDLMLEQIWRLQLAGALVVLSACDGASSDVLPGEELIGLSRALLAAGARDVIASLWGVYDGATQPLLAALYAELARGHDAATALALAQRAMLSAHVGDAVLNLPFVWGAFCAIGAC